MGSRANLSRQLPQRKAKRSKNIHGFTSTQRAPSAAVSGPSEAERPLRPFAKRSLCWTKVGRGSGGLMANCHQGVLAHAAAPPVQWDSLGCQQCCHKAVLKPGRGGGRGRKLTFEQLFLDGSFWRNNKKNNQTGRACFFLLFGRSLLIQQEDLFRREHVLEAVACVRHTPTLLI